MGEQLIGGRGFLLIGVLLFCSISFGWEVQGQEKKIFRGEADANSQSNEKLASALALTSSTSENSEFFGSIFRNSQAPRKAVAPFAFLKTAHPAKKQDPPASGNRTLVKRETPVQPMAIANPILSPPPGFPKSQESENSDGIDASADIDEINTEEPETEPAGSRNPFFSFFKKWHKPKPDKEEDQLDDFFNRPGDPSTNLNGLNSDSLAEQEYDELPVPGDQLELPSHDREPSLTSTPSKRRNLFQGFFSWNKSPRKRIREPRVIQVASTSEERRDQSEWLSELSNYSAEEIGGLDPPQLDWSDRDFFNVDSFMPPPGQKRSGPPRQVPIEYVEMPIALEPSPTVPPSNAVRKSEILKQSTDKPSQSVEFLDLPDEL